MNLHKSVQRLLTLQSGKIWWCELVNAKISNIDLLYSCVIIVMKNKPRRAYTCILKE